MALGGARLAYNVKLGGEVIATVTNKNVYYAAVNIIEEIVECEDVLSILPEVEIETVVTVKETVNDCDEMANVIIDNAEEIVAASRLYIGGEVVGCADTAYIDYLLSERKSAFDIVGAECESEFCSAVFVEEGYFIKNELTDTADIEAAVAALDVKTTVKEVTEQTTPYNSITERTANKPAGYVATTQEGVCGIVRITTDIIYINGVETDRNISNSEIVCEPVDEIITVGTAKTFSRVKSGLYFPLPAGTWEISCPYGKNGHRGVDLCADKGTVIMAAASGTVIIAGTYRDYGYCVMIDHGNGFSTLYAHASKLCVNVGDKVSAGDVIALVGSTGNSTGNHLHFEVYIGDDRVNPQPYIGL